MVKRGLVSGVGVLTGSYLLEGIEYDSTGTLLVAVLLLSFFSAVLKPLLVFFALPFVVLTLGLGVLFINALLYFLVGEFVPGFEVASFGAAFWGALIITFFNLLFAAWINDGKQVRWQATRKTKRNVGGPSAGGQRKVKAKDEIIDI